MALKLRQIEAFRSVMREGSMVRASSAMAITQPAISYLISGLEKEVGFELFSRRGGKLTPTPEALQLMAEVNRLYDGLDGIKAAAQQIANHVTLPLFRVVLNPRFTRPFCAVPRTSAAHTASG